MFIFLLIVFIGVALSWYYIRSDYFQPVEKLAVWMFSLSWLKLTFTIIELNLQWLQMSRNVFHILTVYLTGWIVYAVLQSLTVGILVSGKFKIGTKVVMFVVCGIVLAMGEELFRVAGFLAFIKWNLWYALIRQWILVGTVYGFALVFRKLIQRERVHA
ncbi:hypothetical protein [Brevibacillus dissolubilis]|uniref:hypothetical protein n=1 Tax=Brevibacillus dissolubilis TaxID=1844116 RepID=UPI00111722EE|nr:hypothetical protein [Brevibacillus dissolubilis]